MAAKIAVESGVNAFIVNGRTLECVKKVLSGQKCGTQFVLSKHRKLSKRESWVKYISKPKGVLYVNDGAYTALLARKSLLPVGILNIEGSFEEGDVVLIAHENEIIGRGIVNYSSKDLDKIKGLKSSEIPEDIYTYDEVIHADNLIIEKR
jgi:glutamate 5-kinase